MEALILSGHHGLSKAGLAVGLTDQSDRGSDVRTGPDVLVQRGLIKAMNANEETFALNGLSHGAIQAAM